MISLFPDSLPSKKERKIQQEINEILVHCKVPSVLTVFFLFYTTLLLQCSVHSVQSTSHSNIIILGKGDYILIIGKQILSFPLIVFCQV